MAGKRQHWEESDEDSSGGGDSGVITTRSRSKTPKTPKTANAPKSPKTSRKGSSLTTAKTPAPKTPKTPKSDGTNRIAKTLRGRTPKSAGPKTLRTAAIEEVVLQKQAQTGAGEDDGQAGQSGTNDHEPPKILGAVQENEPTLLKTPNPTPPTKLKDQPTQLLQSLPEVPDDDQHSLCGRPDSFWMNRSKSKLTKEKMGERLNYYVRPNDKKHMLAKKKRGKTKIDLLVGLKQVYYERPEESRWTAQDLITGTGTSGAEYQEACVIDGSMSPSAPEIPKKAPKKPTKKSMPPPKETSKKNWKETSMEPQPAAAETGQPDVMAAESTTELAVSNEPKKPTVEVPRKPTIHGATSASKPRRPQLDERSRRFVEDGTRIALYAFSYHRLSRHPGAFPREPVQANIIMDSGDFQKVIPAAFSANSHIYLQFFENFKDYEQWNPQWRIGSRDHPNPVMSYPIRGRGPVWSQNSCAIDACIVAGMLVDAGSTIADREGDQNWVDHLSSQEHAFLEVLEKNWSIMTREQSYAERNNFWNVFNQGERRKLANSPMSEADILALSEQWQIGKMQPPTTIWGTCTVSYGQFRFRYFSSVDTSTLCEHGRSTKASGYVTENCITPDYSNGLNEDATMSEVLGHYFSHIAPCRHCKVRSVTKNRVVIGHLPPRLVVFPNRKTAINRHTNKVRFNYTSVNSRQWDLQVRSAQSGDIEPKELPKKFDLRTAEYRWLGGIYCHKHHFRVYWADNGRHEPDHGYFKAYDGMCAEGAIVGSIESAHPTERVHPDWVGPGSQIILFYEKILAPTETVLQAAAETIANLQRGGSLAPRTSPSVLQSSNPTHSKDLSRHFVEGSIFRPIPVSDGTKSPIS